MFFAITIIGFGLALAASSVQGIGLVDFLSGNWTKLDPSGGRGGSGGTGTADIPAGAGATPAQGNDPKGEFKGPNAALLRFITNNAKQNFNLSVSQICRPQNATYGSPTSLHKECRAVDLTGAVDDKVAFARWVKPIIDKVGGEVFCDQANMIAPGYQHADHVHVGA